MNRRVSWRSLGVWVNLAVQRRLRKIQKHCNSSLAFYFIRVKFLVQSVMRGTRMESVRHITISCRRYDEAVRNCECQIFFGIIQYGEFLTQSSLSRFELLKTVVVLTRVSGQKWKKSVAVANDVAIQLDKIEIGLIGAEPFFDSSII